MSRDEIQVNGDFYLVRGSYGSSPWKGILRFYLEFKEGLGVKVGNG